MANSRPYLISGSIFRTILLASFAMWFGGFGFYVSFVVPVGTDVLGSATEQGMITRRVTHWINVCSAVALAIMIVESLWTWRNRSRFIRWTQLGMCLFMVGMLATLVYLHPMMDSLIDPVEKSVDQQERFYQLHRVYLWASTFQWIAGWFWLALFAVGMANHRHK